MAWMIDRSTALFCIPGAMEEGDGVRFTAAVRPGQEASVLLFDRQNWELVQEAEFPMEAAIGELRTLKVIGLPWKKVFYCYKINGKAVCDPCAALIVRRDGPEWEETETPQILCELNFEPYDWQGDTFPRIPYEDAVMYHLHVRNFTKHPRSKVRHKGTFLGLAEKIPYLADLGVNQIKLMPVYEPAPQEETGCGTPAGMDAPFIGTASAAPAQKPNCWGYGPGFYYAPRRLFAATKNPVRELKDMVRAMHQNGIEVILEMFFPEEIAVRSVLDCLTYWVREFHIDGFHLMGNEGLTGCLKGDALLAQTKLLCSGCGPLPDGGTRHFAECNDGFLADVRRILKGDEGMLESFAYRTRRNADFYAVVNYLTNHDGFTLMDLVSYDNKHNEANGEHNADGAVYNFSWNCGQEGPSRKKAVLALRRRQLRNAFLLLLLSQGTPMLLAGDEFGNSQSGNNNPYCLDNEISWTDWGAAARNGWLAEFVKKAVAFRREHRILHMSSEFQMCDYQSCGYPDLSYHSGRAWYGGFEYNSRQIGMMYCEKYAGQEGFLYVACNLHPLAQELAVPALPAGMCWYLAADTSLESGFLQEEQRMEECRTVQVPARTILVMTGRKEP